MLNELEQKIRKAIPELMIVNVYNLELIPIQLNHVLEYVLKSKYEDGVNMMFEYEQNELLRSIIINLWNLKSNLLSDQSRELIKFVNELKKD